MRKIRAFIWYQKLHFDGWIHKWSDHNTPLKTFDACNRCRDSRTMHGAADNFIDWSIILRTLFRSRWNIFTSKYTYNASPAWAAWRRPAPFYIGRADIQELWENTLETKKVKNTKHLMYAIGANTHAQRAMWRIPELICTLGFDHAKIFSPANRVDFTGMTKACPGL